MYRESENHVYFQVYFFNIDISPIIALICLKTCMCIAEMCVEGNVSQNLDLGLRFCFMVSRRGNFEEQKSTKVTCFYH